MKNAKLQLVKSQITDCYDKLANAGKFPDNTLLHQSLRELIEPKFRDSTPTNILDAGSGAGFFGLHLAKFGHNLTLVDFSTEALRFARKRSYAVRYDKRINTAIGDVEHLPFASGSFDAVVCIFVFSHLNNPDKAIGELSRVLRAGGRLIIHFENRSWHAIAAGLHENYEEAIWLMSSDKPIIKAYDILPPVRLYSAKEIEDLCRKHRLQIDSFAGLRHLTSYQETLRGIGTTDTEYILRDNAKANELEKLLTNSGELLSLARHLLICASPVQGDN